MIDYFKVAMNEADRRIKMEVYLNNLIKAVENGDDFDIKLATRLAKEMYDEPFDKYENADS